MVGLVLSKNTWHGNEDALHQPQRSRIWRRNLVVSGYCVKSFYGRLQISLRNYQGVRVKINFRLQRLQPFLPPNTGHIQTFSMKFPLSQNAIKIELKIMHRKLWLHFPLHHRNMQMANIKIYMLNNYSYTFKYNRQTTYMAAMFTHSNTQSSNIYNDWNTCKQDSASFDNILAFASPSHSQSQFRNHTRSHFQMKPNSNPLFRQSLFCEFPKWF